MTISTSDDPRPAIRAEALRLGFQVCGFADATRPWPASARLEEFIAKGRHGTMTWMATTAARRANPRGMWPSARSAIVVGMNYGPEGEPLAILGQRSNGAISVYAQGRDYHGVIKGKLKHLASAIVRQRGGEAKVFVDTAPLMEKPLAARAGVGWQGKHTNLVSRTFGSWLFLGSVLTSVELPADDPESDHCGACRACLDVCPTAAFPAPYQLDARACLSYLTIEHDGPIPDRYRAAMGNRVFGCDDCLAVCPWNKFAVAGGEAKLAAREASRAPRLAELAALDDVAFRARFAGTAVKRIGRDRLVRNALYAIGNSEDIDLLNVAMSRLADGCDFVREAASWAVQRLTSASVIPPAAGTRSP